MSTRLGGSLPQKLRHPADLQVFYRLMSCEQVTHQSIQAAHRAATIETIQQINGQELIDWMLLTNEPITSFDDASECVNVWKTAL